MPIVGDRQQLPPSAIGVSRRRADGAAPPRDGAAPPGDTFGSSSSTDGVLNSVGSHLQDSFLYRQYGYRPPALKLGKNAALWANLRVKLYKPTDSLIQGDPQRAATTRAAQQSGKPITWAEIRGALNPGLWLPLWVPIGPIGATMGFSGDAKLGFSILSPYSQHIAHAIKDLSFRPPMSAAGALRLTRGTEIAVEGHGQIAVSAGVNAGNSFLPINGPLTLGLSYGVNTYLSEKAALKLRVKRMGGSRVRVTISHVATRGKGETSDVRVGVHSNLGKILPKASGLVGMGEKFAVGQVSGLIERWLSLDASQIYSKSDSGRTVASYELDLSKPGAAAAYDALMALDTRPAQALAFEGPSTGVWSASLVSGTRTTTNEFNAHFGPIRLLSDTHTSTITHERLTTRRGLMTLDSGTVTARYGDILTRWWSGRKRAQSEIVSSNLPGSAQRSTLWHLSSDLKVDGWTSAANVRKFLLTAGALGVQNAATTKALGDGKFQDSFGATEMVLDANLTPGGMAHVLAATPLQVGEAFSAAFEHLDEPYRAVPSWLGSSHAWQTSPWLKTGDPHYGAVMQLLEAGPNSNVGGRGNKGQASRSAQYYWITGRDLGTDCDGYKQSLKFEALIAKLRAAQSPQQQAAILAASRDDFSSDDRKELYALGTLAGPGGVEVNQASILDRDHKKTFAYATQRPFADPQAMVQGWLNDPRKGPVLGG